MSRTHEDELSGLLRGQAVIVQEVYSILEEEQKKDELLRAAVLSSMKHRENRVAGLDPLRTYDVEDIRRACVKYRLRFLPAGRFKGNIPREAIYTLRQLEARSDAPLGGFKIMAPAKRFRLCDGNADPLLFIPVGGGSYYLVHQWGRSLGPWRAVTGWPFRNWKNLVVTVFLASVIIGALTPSIWLSADPTVPWWDGHRLMAVFSTTVILCAATAFGWLAFFGQFSEEAWDSETFN